MKEELSVFNKNIPVLLTSAYLYKVLVHKEFKNVKTIEFYECKKEIPIKPEENLLVRPLIPLYRNRRIIDYHLSNEKWNPYRLKIIEVLNRK